MAETQIEWTDATWNPVAGCSIVTAGCTNCYAMQMARRLEAMGVEKYAGLTRAELAARLEALERARRASRVTESISAAEAWEPAFFCRLRASSTDKRRFPSAASKETGPSAAAPAARTASETARIGVFMRTSPWRGIIG